jgi:hypothetical protein
VNKAVLLPILLYAAVVWWPMVSRVQIRNLLCKLQGNYLRTAVGCKKTPMEALEVALCVQIKMSGRMEEYRVRSYKAQKLWQHLQRLLPNHSWFGSACKC